MDDNSPSPSCLLAVGSAHHQLLRSIQLWSTDFQALDWQFWESHQLQESLWAGRSKAGLRAKPATGGGKVEQIGKKVMRKTAERRREGTDASRLTIIVTGGFIELLNLRVVGLEEFWIGSTLVKSACLRLGLEQDAHKTQRVCERVTNDFVLVVNVAFDDNYVRKKGVREPLVHGGTVTLICFLEPMRIVFFVYWMSTMQSQFAGGTNRLGKETVRVLAKRGACLYIAACNWTAAEKVTEDIVKEAPNARIDTFKLTWPNWNLCVRTAAKEFLGLTVP